MTATGEPATCLAISAYFAVKECIQSSRKDNGLPKEFLNMGTPASPEVILLNCGTNSDKFLIS